MSKVQNRRGLNKNSSSFDMPYNLMVLETGLFGKHFLISGYNLMRHVDKLNIIRGQVFDNLQERQFQGNQYEHNYYNQKML